MREINVVSVSKDTYIYFSVYCRVKIIIEFWIRGRKMASKPFPGPTDHGEACEAQRLDNHHLPLRQMIHIKGYINENREDE
jgi:hypothetical protein